MVRKLGAIKPGNLRPAKSVQWQSCAVAVLARAMERNLMSEERIGRFSDTFALPWSDVRILVALGAGADIGQNGKMTFLTLVV
jgi:hypothetical protein